MIKEQEEMLILRILKKVDISKSGGNFRGYMGLLSENNDPYVSCSHVKLYRGKLITAMIAITKVICTKPSTWGSIPLSIRLLSSRT